MTIDIRLFTAADTDAVVAFALRAWAPVFESFAKVLGPDIYPRVYPDWQTSQADAVARTCTEHAGTTWVAALAEQPVGFVTVIVDRPASAGEIEMIAVDPDHQRTGIATALIEHAVAWMRADGLHLAAIGTGGDPGHAPARALYEKAGFTPFPQVRYHQAL